MLDLNPESIVAMSKFQFKNKLLSRDLSMPILVKPSTAMPSRITSPDYTTCNTSRRASTHIL